MPTLFEIFTDPISLIVLAMYFGLLILEKLAPATDLPQVKGWTVKGILFFLAFFLLSTYLPIFWDSYFARYQLVDLSGIAVWQQSLAAVLLYELGVYVWHRSLHRFNWLWRGFHQMHHSAERLDVSGAFFFSPLDMLGWTALGSFTLVFVAGFDAAAATYAILITTFLGIFQHANIATPQWLGYIIQRPESHAVHHSRAVHRNNYADLPLFDIILGTFENPKHRPQESGFYDGASERLTDMLLFKDVSKSDIDNQPEDFKLPFQYMEN